MCESVKVCVFARSTVAISISVAKKPAGLFQDYFSSASTISFVSPDHSRAGAGALAQIRPRFSLFSRGVKAAW